MIVLGFLGFILGWIANDLFTRFLMEKIKEHYAPKDDGV